MYLCKFGQNPSTGSKDIASDRSYADAYADADGIRTKNNMSPTFGCGDIIKIGLPLLVKIFYMILEKDQVHIELDNKTAKTKNLVHFEIMV